MLPGLEELGAGAFDSDERGLGHVPAAWAMTASRRAMRRWCRSASYLLAERPDSTWRAVWLVPR